MKKKINIAEILKDKPKGIRLYSPIFGECAFSFVREETDDICVKQHNGEKAFFNSKGLYNILGECLLFPSKEMRDWRKFAWKKGDVLVSNDYCTEVIFYDWYDDTYTNFYGKHRLDSENKNNIKYNDAFLCTTGRYSIEDKDAAQTYINAIEERLGGKLNRETLEIEKHEFKDGDILYVKTKLGSEYIMINKLSEEVKTACYVACNLSSKKIFWNRIHSVCRDEEIGILRQATDYEKSQLFEALAKKNKVWNAEKKQVVDLKIKWMTLKPFDKVITRVDVNAIWTANIFSHMDSHGKYVTIGFAGSYPYCLPYNDETAHLIGTTDEWKGCNHD